MNWKKLLLNLGGVAAGGFATAMAQAPAGGTPNKSTIIGATVVPLIANVLGLFQQPPHQDA